MQEKVPEFEVRLVVNGRELHIRYRSEEGIRPELIKKIMELVAEEVERAAPQREKEDSGSEKTVPYLPVFIPYSAEPLYYYKVSSYSTDNTNDEDEEQIRGNPS